MVQKYPIEWSTAQLKDLNEYVSSNMQPKNHIGEYFELFSVPIFPEGKPEIVEASEIGSSKQIVNYNDVLISKINPRINRVWKVSEPKQLKQIASSEWITVRSSLISSQFLTWYFRANEFRERLCADVTGVGGSLTRAQPKKVATFDIPVPPLTEQKVIAETLDKLLAKVDSIKARLDAVPDTLKRFRQSVLAAAVSGEFTEEWDTTPYALEDVSSFQNGFAFKSGWFEKSGTWQVVKLGNIRDGNLLLSNSPAYVSDDIAAEYERYRPQQGDTLISMTGTRFKQDYGFACKVGVEDNILINQRVGRITPNMELVTPDFLNLFIRSELFRHQFFKGETGGVNQGNVGSKHIMSIAIHCPNIEVQNRVTRLVEQLFAYADKVEAEVNAAQERVNKLTQSILAKAFRGELTAKWREQTPELISGDNSAEALLEKIKAEREKLKPKKKTRTKK